MQDYIQPVKKIIKHHKTQKRDERAQESRGRASGVTVDRVSSLKDKKNKDKDGCGVYARNNL